MKTLTRKISRTAITMALVTLAFIAIFRAWVYYTESPWTRDARFSADVVAIAPDVAGLITAVNIHDNQLMKKDQVPDEILIKQVILGETSSYREIVERYQKQIYGIGMRFFKN